MLLAISYLTPYFSGSLLKQREDLCSLRLRSNQLEFLVLLPGHFDRPRARFNERPRSSHRSHSDKVPIFRLEIDRIECEGSTLGLCAPPTWLHARLCARPTTRSWINLSHDAVTYIPSRASLRRVKKCRIRNSGTANTGIITSGY